MGPAELSTRPGESMTRPGRCLENSLVNIARALVQRGRMIG